MVRFVFMVLIISCATAIFFYLFNSRVRSISGDNFAFDQKTTELISSSLHYPYAGLTIAMLKHKHSDGDWEATFELGRRYIDGTGVSRDESLGNTYLDQAIDGGSADATEYKAMRIFDPNAISDKNIPALKLMSFAAASNKIASTANLCRYYYADKKYREALLWCGEGANMGIPMAMEFYGDMLASGNGGSKDQVSARNWICKAREMKRRVNYTLGRHDIVCDQR